MIDRSQKFPRQGQTRRKFIKNTAAAIGGGALLHNTPVLLGASTEVLIVLDAGDASLKKAPVSWAVEELRSALKARGLGSSVQEGPAEGPSDRDRILVTRRNSTLACPILEKTDVTLSNAPESLALVRPKQGMGDLLVCGSDARGLVYGLLELADRMSHAADPLLALRAVDRIVQRPANPIRSITRLFTSEPEDKPWFYDKPFWERYLTVLTRERFNRFSLALGLGYNAPRNVPDSYFYFAYPFLFSVPGYQVTARGLSDQERQRNFEMLGWISQQATRRGLHFQLALWTHAYQFVDSPNVNYPIDGLTPENHPAYCRDAIGQLLKSYPHIAGVTLRGHSESGIPEGSYEFWRHILDGIAQCGRKVEIDFHAKGIEHKLLDMALKTGCPVQISAKYWAEHMGLPYHQASIREQERAATGERIEQQRRFTRYGYADYLREDRGYGVYYRMWPGTQRVLLWGDPVMAAAYGRHSTFCGSLGLELMEPLSFKGRMGSGSPGGRNPYIDPSLTPEGGDWEKYLYGYRIWGRLLYDPNENADCWGRMLKSEFGPAAKDCEDALAHASRILPLVTTAHHPSASNNRYWPEIYTDMPVVDAERRHPYSDTPNPKRFGTCSSLDPVLFASVEDFADELIKGQRTGRYSPLDVARWLEEFARSAEDHLSQAQKVIARAEQPSFRRLATDVKVQAGLGRFFAEKFRAAAAFAIHERTGDRVALEEALKHYRAARDAWGQIAKTATGVYAQDLTFGREPYLRGHWADRRAAIEADLKDMEKVSAKTSSAGQKGESSQKTTAALLVDLASKRSVERPSCEHRPPASFRPGAPFSVELAQKGDYRPSLVRLHYRHVNQAEAYRVADMNLKDERFRCVIPGQYTDSLYPLMYFFELRDSSGNAHLYPGLEPDLSNQPYFVVRAG